MKTITTKAELEALSEDAVIMIYEHGVEPNAAVLSVLISGPLWFTTVDAPSNNGDGYSHEAIWRMYGEDDDGYPRITLIHPLVFDQADVELAARALAVEDNCIFPDDDTVLYVDKARAALGAVGEVEQELREAVTDEIHSVVAAFSDSQMEALLTGDLVAAHERTAALTHSEETHHVDS